MDRVARVMVGIGVASLCVATSLTPANASTPAPVLRWQASYNAGPQHHDYGARVATARHAIFVAASSDSPDRPADFTLLRYRLDGTLLWRRHLTDATQIGSPSDLVVHPGGGVVVTGYVTHVDALQITTVRVSDDGTIMWRRDAELGDRVRPPTGPRLAIADDGSVRVSGTSNEDFAVLSYSSDGALQWRRSIDVSEGGADNATGIAIGAAGSSYVVGSAGEHGGYAVARLSRSGTVSWTRGLPTPIGNVLGPAYARIAPGGDLVVAGTPESTCGVFHAGLWRLTATGDPLWNRVYPSEPCESAEVIDLDLRADGSTVLAGDGGTVAFDLLTISYSATGDLSWVAQHDGGSTDIAAGLDLDTAGNAYITGTVSLGLPADDIYTASYRPDGTLRWADRLDLHGAAERASDIALLPRGDAIVTGTGFDRKHWEYAFTLRYAGAHD